MTNEQQQFWNDYRSANCTAEQTKTVLQVLKLIVQRRKPKNEVNTTKP